jgi:hypothetical protein
VHNSSILFSLMWLVIPVYRAFEHPAVEMGKECREIIGTGVSAVASGAGERD